VFASGQAMVIGPSPPGTGVIAPATRAADPGLAAARVDPVDAHIDHRRARPANSINFNRDPLACLMRCRVNQNVCPLPRFQRRFITALPW
jgi:hypothetical protein